MADPNKNAKIINGVPLREAETTEEKLLLGFLHQEAQDVGFGQVVVEFTVHGKRIIRMRADRVSRTFNIGERNA
jgi:hypothetical protein